MGQEQSTLLPSVNQILSSTESTTGDQLQQQSGPSDVHGGIIEVVKGSESSRPEEEIMLLQNIATFKPFLTEESKGFNIDKLLGLRTSTSRTSTAFPSLTEGSDIMESIVTDISVYVRTNSKDVNDKQKELLKRIAYADLLTFASLKSMSSGFAQAKIISDKLPEVNFIKEQAAKAQQQATHIFQLLSSIEEHFDPEDIITPLHNEDLSQTGWRSELTDLRAQALQPLSHPAPPALLERYITSTSDVATLSTTTTSSPQPEEVVLTSGTASATVQTLHGPTEAASAANRSVSSHSVVLDRLRGLSSRSIPHDASIDDSES